VFHRFSLNHIINIARICDIFNNLAIPALDPGARSRRSIPALDPGARSRRSIPALDPGARRSTLDARRSTLDARRSTLDARRQETKGRKFFSLFLLIYAHTALTLCAPGIPQLNPIQSNPMKKIFFHTFASIAALLGIAAAVCLFLIVYTIFQGTGLLPVYFFGFLFSGVMTMMAASMAEGLAEY
jgi:hypothetical protein